jgi:hypothetical protein
LPVFRNETSEGLPESATLERIKQELDPAFSYVIFEKDGPAEKNIWIELYASLGGLNLPVLELKTFEDPGRAKVLLVARFEGGRTEAIVQEMIGARLPNDVIFYVYGSSRAG